jgi:large subunit ribosomal protein L1
VNNAKAGQVRYRTDKNGIIHAIVGNVEFSADAIKQNLEALLVDLKKAKPAAAKGIYLKKVTLSSTMGPGLLVDQGTIAI